VVNVVAKRAAPPSRATQDALETLGNQIKEARIRRGWTQSNLAARAGIDSRTVSAIEKGAPTVSIGTVFNTAFITGVDLFGLEGDDLALARRRGQERLALLPTRIRNDSTEDDTDADF
jgi:transcriptional regulator with XRE-family HTH domain